MGGIYVFDSLNAALREGYHVYDKQCEGYLVRKRLSQGWGLALVRCAPKSA
jgi:hypothetical protein